MMDIDLPAGVFDESAERALLYTLTDTLLRWEGADPTDPRMQAIAWIFVHRSTAVYVGGKPAQAPHYRVRVSVPQGQFNDKRRAGMIDAVTTAILDAEGGRYERDPQRVWVFPIDVPEGTWGRGWNRMAPCGRRRFRHERSGKGPGVRGTRARSEGSR